MTDQQLFQLFAPVAPMPASVHDRLLRRMRAELRRYRLRRQLRRVVVLVFAVVMLALAVSSASAQVWCDPCPPRVYLPFIAIEGGVDAATRFWGG